MSYLASLLGRPVRRAATAELTAAGAAGTAGIAAGLWSPSDYASLLPAGRIFTPPGPPPEGELARWKDAVSRSLRWE
jgi:glycerol kinase